MLLRAGLGLLGAFGLAQANAAVVVRNLQVEYRETPIGTDIAQPRFSWQMAATAGERGLLQSAYEIRVRDPKGTLVWDSKKKGSAAAVGIQYSGDPLKAAT